MISGKSYIIAWWLIILSIVLLWYRNSLYDRIVSSIFLIIAVICLLLYGCYNNLDTFVAGKITVILLYILTIIISVSTFMYTHNSIAAIISAILIIRLTVVCIDIFYGQDKYVSFVPCFHTKEEVDSYMCGNKIDYESSIPVWSLNGSTIIKQWVIVFLISIIICWMILLKHHGWDDVGLYIIAVYLILTFLYLIPNTDEYTVGPVYMLVLSGIILIVWFAGIMREICSG